MGDGRDCDQTKLSLRPLTGPIMERALLVGDEQGSMQELGVLLSAVGVPRIMRIREPSSIESHLTGTLAIFVDSAAPARVLQVARSVGRQPAQAWIVAVGAPATPREMFEYGRGGVSAFLESPVDRDALRACLTHAVGDDLGSLARALVGRMGLKEAQRELRVLMVSHALRLCRGSRRSAARLLAVTRPAIQRVLRESEGLDASTVLAPLDEQRR